MYFSSANMKRSKEEIVNEKHIIITSSHFFSKVLLNFFVIISFYIFPFFCFYSCSNYNQNRKKSSNRHRLLLSLTRVICFFVLKIIPLIPSSTTFFNCSTAWTVNFRPKLILHEVTFCEKLNKKLTHMAIFFDQL